MDAFPSEVSEHLNFYVYRLVDPRNCETFYVGKGRGNRVFDHVKHTLNFSADREPEDDISLKMIRIRNIHDAGLEVITLIHIHGLDEATAFRVEAALIDAYPGLSNAQAGHDSDLFGVAHVKEVVARYQAEELIPESRLILINIGRTYHQEGRNLYSAVRGFWRLDPARARRASFVLAHSAGIVRGAFIADAWLTATPQNFPELAGSAGFANRWGFDGRAAPPDVTAIYKGKRIPPAPRGAANPIRYLEP